MLERVATCIEPASQLILRRLEPPVRSQRALGSSFWRNGGNQLDVPPWWPLYLKHLRASRQNEAALDPSLLRPRPSSLADSSEGSLNRRPRALKRDQSSKPSSYQTSSRTYTRSSATAHKTSAVPVVEDDESSQFAGSTPFGNSVQQPSDNYLATANAGEVTFAPFSRVPFTQVQKQLREILQRHRGPEPKGTDDADLDLAWKLYNHIPDQQACAPDIFRVLSKSDRDTDHARALVAFGLMSEKSRTRDDYEQAVRAALKMDDYYRAIEFCARATRRNLQDGCGVFFLLHAVSNGLWFAAARVWHVCFKPSPFGHHRASPAYIALIREMGNHRDIPHALYQLGSRLCQRAPITMREAGILKSLFDELFEALVGNGQLMSIITPQGLQNLFKITFDLHRTRPSLYVTAITTINKLAVRPDKGSLADLVYTTLRSDLPGFPPGASTFGSLLSIHVHEGAPARTYIHYLDEFAKFHGVADPMSFQKVLSALAAQGDIDGVQHVFQRLSQAHGCPTDPAFYTPLMYVYARLGDVPATQRGLQKMIDAGAEPHSYAWNILIYAHSRSPQPERASQVLDMMKTAGVKPDAYTFTTLMSIYSRFGDTDTVLDFLEQAQQNQVKGSYALLTGLVQSYLLNDQAEAAERIAETATIAGLQGYPTTMWNYLLRHYAFLADSESMLRIQRRMATLGVKSDEMTHAAFMTALVVLGKTRDAVQILRTLNLSQTLAATQFHYAIILHGFAQEGDRDMASVIYQEMVERFPRLGPSPHLAKLHLQARRNPIENERPEYAEEYLAQILHQLSTEDRAHRQPQPGLRRRQAVEAVPSLHVEYFVDLLLKRGQIKRAEQLDRQFEKLNRSPYLHLGNTTAASIPFLSTRLTLRAAKQDWDEVEKIWNLILERAMHIATRTSPHEEQDFPRTLESDKKMDVPEAAGVLPIQPVGLPEAGMMPSNYFSFGSMIQQSATSDRPLDNPGRTVLFAQRYLLDAPLTRYLNTLALQNIQDRAITLVAKLEKAGFSLTSKNWNKYVQILTQSDNPEHWTLAYQVFEQKMIANTPPWPVLRRGEWLPPSPSKTERSIAVPRRSIETRDPGQLMPTYYTAIHLGNALLKANILAAEGDRTTNMAIRKAAPLTRRYIRRMPYLKDRLQGLLLRGRKLRILPPRHPRFFREADRSGVLGSKSPADHVPAEAAVELEGGLGDLSSPRAVSDMYFGHPVVPTTAGSVRRATPAGNTLYGTEYHRLVNRARHGKRI